MVEPSTAADDKTNPVGTGPFKLKSWVKGDRVELVRDPNYWETTKKIALDTITFRFIGDPQAQVAALQSGDVDAMAGIGAAELYSKFQNDKRFAAVIGNTELKVVAGMNSTLKPFDDVRVRRALALALDQWRGAPALAKIANVHTVGGIVFPGSPLAATKEELQKLPGFWPDIEKSRTEAKRLLKEAGAEGLSFELMNRNVDQPYKYVAAFVMDEWSKIGLKVTQRVIPTGPFYEGLRNGNFDVTVDFNCQGVVNPPLDTAKYLPRTIYPENYGNYEDDKEVELYNKMLHEADPAKQRVAMREYEKHVLDTHVHAIMTPWWYRIIPYRSYVKGWKISPSHYINMDFAQVWLDR